MLIAFPYHLVSGVFPFRYGPLRRRILWDERRVLMRFPKDGNATPAADHRRSDMQELIQCARPRASVAGKVNFSVRFGELNRR